MLMMADGREMRCDDGRERRGRIRGSMIMYVMKCERDAKMDTYTEPNDDRRGG